VNDLLLSFLLLGYGLCLEEMMEIRYDVRVRCARVVETRCDARVRCARVVVIRCDVRV
jgi:hypothetical protein